VNGLGDSQTGCRQQAEQGLVGCPAQIRGETASRRQQVDDLLLGEDVRDQSLSYAAEDGVIRADPD
jgi:hypothetical protein